MQDDPDFDRLSLDHDLTNVFLSAAYSFQAQTSTSIVGSLSTQLPRRGVHFATALA